MNPVTSSQAVSFWSVHAWVQKYLDHAGDFPMVGTPAWCLLPDFSREKWAAILDAAQHWALRVECAQEAHAEAAKAVAASTDWPELARQQRARANCSAYVPRKGVVA